MNAINTTTESVQCEIYLLGTAPWRDENLSQYELSEEWLVLEMILSETGQVFILALRPQTHHQPP